MERSVRELAGGLEDILWKTAASEVCFVLIIFYEHFYKWFLKLNVDI